jgi:DNA polymerase I
MFRRLICWIKGCRPDFVGRVRTTTIGERMNYKYITRQEEVRELLPVLMSKPAQGLDTETTGLDAHVDKVILMQIGDEHQQYVIDTRKVNVEPLKPWFESEEHKKIGHNLKFDYKMIRGSFSIKVEAMRCTYLGERLLVVGKQKKRIRIR